MRQFVQFECLECGHMHDCEIVRGETLFDDYAEVPEYCEHCGADTDSGPSTDNRRDERRQMGVTF